MKVWNSLRDKAVGFRKRRLHKRIAKMAVALKRLSGKNMIMVIAHDGGVIISEGGQFSMNSPGVPEPGCVPLEFVGHPSDQIPTIAFH